MTALVHVMGRLFNTPLFLDAGKAQVIADVILNRPQALGGEGSISIGAGGATLAITQEGVSLQAADDRSISTPEASRFVGSYRRENRPGSMVRADRGVALVSVTGSLVNRGAWIGSNSGLTSYEGTLAQIRDAAQDPEVHSIVLDIDSYGGEATGTFRLADQIRQVRAEKRVIALVDDVAASAAYGMAAAASEIWISPTSIVGSIGVVLLHLDQSAKMEKEGVKPTFIHAGAYKVDGNSASPLSDETRGRLQATVDQFYARFLESVATGRGDRLSEAQARATEARIYIGQAAIDAGLADRIGSLDQVLSELARPRGGGGRSSGATRMSDTTPSITQAQVDNAVAAARLEGAAAGATAERARITAIVRSDVSAGRETTALAMALDTDMKAEDAVKVLGMTPKGSAVPPLAQRALDQGAGEFGANSQGAPAAHDPWKSAVATANQRFERSA